MIQEECRWGFISWTDCMKCCCRGQTIRKEAISYLLSTQHIFRMDFRLLYRLLCRPLYISRKVTRYICGSRRPHLLTFDIWAGVLPSSIYYSLIRLPSAVNVIATAIPSYRSIISCSLGTCRTPL